MSNDSATRVLVRGHAIRERVVVGCFLLLAAVGGTVVVATGGRRGPVSEFAGSAVPVCASAPRAVTSTAVLRWVGCGISKTAFMQELARAYTERTGVRIVLEGGGATRGLREVAAGRSDLGGSCRHALEVAAERDVELVPVGWDALVVIAHPSCPVDGIRLEQLRAVLRGEIRRWSGLGGPDAPLHLVTRTQGPGGKISGVGRMLRELVFHDPEATFSPDAVHVASSGPLERRIERDPLAIGVTGLSSARRRRVKILALDGVAPSYEAVANGRYPLIRPLYLVLPRRSGTLSPAVQAFARFAVGEEGQAVLRRMGTVTLEDGAGLWDRFRDAMTRAGVAMGLY